MRFLSYIKKQELKEALSPSQFRELMKSDNYKSFYPTFFNSKDKKNDRKYYPIDIKDLDILDDITSTTKKTIDNYLYANKINNKFFYITDYKQGLAKEKLSSDKKQIIDKNGKQLEVTNKPIIIKIGKLLGMSKDPKAKTVKLLYDQDPIRTGVKLNSKDFLIVFSRHPYDVGGMSTDRGWTSCMNLYNGSNRHHVKDDITEGTIIAYLINKDDKNIKHPYARVLIKPYLHSEKQDVMLVVDNIYGLDVPEFKETVTSIINKEINQKLVNGLYYLNDKLYNDDSSTLAVKNDEDIVSKVTIDNIDDFSKELVSSKKFFDALEKGDLLDQFTSLDYAYIPINLRYNKDFMDFWSESNYDKILRDADDWSDVPDSLTNNSKFVEEWLEQHQEYFEGLDFNKIPKELLENEFHTVLDLWCSFNASFEQDWDDFYSDIQQIPKHFQEYAIEVWLEKENRYDEYMNMERDEIPDPIYDSIKVDYNSSGRGST